MRMDLVRYVTMCVDLVRYITGCVDLVRYVTMRVDFVRYVTMRVNFVRYVTTCVDFVRYVTNAPHAHLKSDTPPIIQDDIPTFNPITPFAPDPKCEVFMRLTALLYLTLGSFFSGHHTPVPGHRRPQLECWH